MRATLSNELSGSQVIVPTPGLEIEVFLATAPPPLRTLSLGKLVRPITERCYTSMRIASWNINSLRKRQGRPACMA